MHTSRPLLAERTGYPVNLPGQVPHVVRLEGKSRIADRFGQRRRSRGNHRQPRRHRFDDRQAIALVQRWNDQHVRGAIKLRELLVVHLAQEADPVSDAEAVSQLLAPL